MLATKYSTYLYFVSLKSHSLVYDNNEFFKKNSQEKSFGKSLMVLKKFQLAKVLASNEDAPNVANCRLMPKKQTGTVTVVS